MEEVWRARLLLEVKKFQMWRRSLLSITLTQEYCLMVGEGYECLSGFEMLHFFVRAIGTKVQVRVRLKIIFIAKIHFLPVIISGHCIY